MSEDYSHDSDGFEDSGSPDDAVHPKELIANQRPSTRAEFMFEGDIDWYFRTMFAAIKDRDPHREGLQDTPNRVIQSWDELFIGNFQDPSLLFTTFEPEGYNEMVVLAGFDFYSTCEHHLLPFHGKAHVAYVPDKRIVGISKLSRLVEMFSRRLQNQERLTQEVCDTLETYLQPLGTAVLLEGRHFCMCSRGARNKAVMVTSALRGCLKESPESRNEFLLNIAPYRGA